jgi:hypothetical protein
MTTAQHPEPVPFIWRAILNAVFARCAAAGYGRVEHRPDGSAFFEAFPGQEDAAADFIEALLLQRDVR